MPLLPIQSAGVFHIPQVSTQLTRDPESLCTTDNEIWLEKTHFDFLVEENLSNGPIIAKK
jgi:hypothetical protein